MISFDYIITENVKDHNLTYPKILYHTYRILIVWGFGSGKANPLFNLISRELQSVANIWE